MAEIKRILVVDDEPQITRVLRRTLSAQGYEVQTSGDGEEALEVFRNWNPGLVITDLSMPVMGGLELCRRIRKISATPVIVLSVKGEERAKVEALDAGADDYITKPFGVDELLARIRVAFRRLQVADERQLREVGDFHLDLDARNISVMGREIHLTPKEYELLTYLIRHAGKVLTHRTLLGAVWGGDYTEQNEYLRVFIGQLRKKIEPDPAHPCYIITEPWVGYRFLPEGTGS